MTRPKAIEWLEDQTGEQIDYVPEAGSQERHLSVRLTGDLAEGLGQLAAERGITVSQLVRALLADIVDQRRSVNALDDPALIDRLQADVAEVRRRLAG